MLYCIYSKLKKTKNPTVFQLYESSVSAEDDRLNS
jgi:hypothetical protein